ncbi:hypothetical protein ACIP2X_19245 [Streptomyces sp. NPDC089424]|uniref:hypothetical protein n=1 Tax=Streptomyces sp. NPDC089424 TaxID=3365917 RepID=UPI00382D9581
MIMITVKPERSRLVAFARWATAQTPKVRTVGLGEFGVPACLFVHAPEEVLIGALVDGHRYVSPSEDATNGLTEPGGHQDLAGTELLGVATPEALMTRGDPRTDVVRLATKPPVSDAAVGGDRGDEHGPESDFAPLEDALTDVDEGNDQDREAVGDGSSFACYLCPREFNTERGRDSHRRQVHRED